MRTAPRSIRITPTPILRAVAAALMVAGVLVVITWTLLTDGSHLLADFPANAWLMHQQAEALSHGTFPSLTLTSQYEAFYPAFAFYGGTFFAFGGVITLLVGDQYAAETIVHLLVLAGAYGGWFWLARLAGVRSWLAHAPAILYVTAPYVLTNINVRQDLVELGATSMIPLLLASALSVLRADRLRAGPAAALAVSTVFYGGTHNLTLLWGTTILIIAGLVVAVAVPQARRQVTRKGVLRVLTIVVPAMAVNAWYLLPDLAYQADTIIASRIDEWQALLKGPHPELVAKNLFALGRPSDDADSGLSLTLPVLTMGWVVLAALVSRARWRETAGRMLVVLILLTSTVLLVMTHPRWLLILPDPWTMIQFSYRLETYALFGICGAVIAALVLLDRRGNRWLVGLLLPILALSIVGAGIQRHDAPHYPFQSNPDIDTFKSFAFGDYADGRIDQQFANAGARLLTVKRTDVTDGKTDVTAVPGDIIYTNLMTPARMLDVQGARIVARWPAPPLQNGWQARWGLVLEVDSNATAGKVHVVIRGVRSLPVVAGRIISILGVLGLVAIAAAMAQAAWRRRSA